MPFSTAERRSGRQRRPTAGANTRPSDIPSIVPDFAAARYNLDRSTSAHSLRQPFAVFVLSAFASFRDFVIQIFA